MSPCSAVPMTVNVPPNSGTTCAGSPVVVPLDSPGSAVVSPLVASPVGVASVGDVTSSVVAPAPELPAPVSVPESVPHAATSTDSESESLVKVSIGAAYSSPARIANTTRGFVSWTAPPAVIASLRCIALPCR